MFSREGVKNRFKKGLNKVRWINSLPTFTLSRTGRQPKKYGNKKMKITIELQPHEVAGIKKYLKSTSHDISPKITKADIINEVQGLVNVELQSGALGDFISEQYFKAKSKTDF